MESKYNSLIEWRKAEPSAYNSAYRKGNLPEICEQFGWTYKSDIKKNNTLFLGIYITKKYCLMDAMKYQTENTWKENSINIYNVALINNWVEYCVKKIITNQKTSRKPNGYWNKERCIEESIKFHSTKEWMLNSNGSYQAAKKNDWYEECKSYMNITFKRKWTKEKCLKESIKYRTIAEWGKHSKHSYQAAYRNGWLDECKIHLMNGRLNNNKSNGNDGK
jgi:hypothetical protein